MSRWRVAVAAGVLILGVACGDSDDEAAQDATTEASSSETAAADTTAAPADDGEAAAGGATSVVAEGFAFVPASIEVPVGTAVTWENRDGAPHTVTAGTPENDTGQFHQAVDGGETVEVSFDEAGTFPYYCTIHPTMTGEVVVS